MLRSCQLEPLVSRWDRFAAGTPSEANLEHQVPEVRCEARESAVVAPVVRKRMQQVRNADRLEPRRALATLRVITLQGLSECERTPRE